MRITKFTLAGIGLLTFSLTSATDPWNQANEMLRQAVKRTDPISNPYSDSGNNDVKDAALYIPMDYYREDQERLYESFWKDEASEWQRTVYSLLTESSDRYDNTDATYTLAQLHLWGDYGFPHNKTLAFRYASRFNEMTKWSNSSILFDLGVMYSTGLFGYIPVDTVKSLLCYQMSASLGNIRAKNALAYKYYSGHSVPRDCSKALLLYKEIADEIRDSFSDEEWNVRFPYIETYNVRIPDFSDGLLGKDLSSMDLTTKRVASARPDITSSFLTQMNGGQIVLKFGSRASGGAFSTEDDESEDRLVDIYYTAWDDYRGTYTKARDCEASRKLLELTFRAYDADVPYMDNLQKFFYGRCLDLLGHIYFTGEAEGSPNITLAEKYLRRSIEVIEKNSSLRCRSNIDLGLINQYLYNNVTEALRYYKKVSATHSNDGTVEFQLAKLSRKYPEMELGDPFGLMQTAHLLGHCHATYEFATMTEQSMNNRYSCEDSAYLYKKFVEGNEQIMAPQLRTAYGELLRGNAEVALWGYALAAEQGFEPAQVSAAYILYQLPCNFEEPPRTLPERKQMAISYYIRAFKQDNVDAGVVAGDIFYRMGNYSKALSAYQSAALKFSPQAIWNLGYMYEHGLGTEVDFHLAKRYYDQALEHNSKLYLAVKLSVLKLRLKSWLTWVTNGRLKYGRIDDDDIVNDSDSWFERIIKSFKKANRENSGIPISNDAQSNGRGVPAQRQRQTQQEQRQQRQQQDAEQEQLHVTIWDRLENLGIQPEDLMTIAFVLFIFLFSLIIRTLAARRGWNVRNNNGMRIQINGQRPRGNFDIQVLAI
ncbi:hypothetical protein HG537_0B05120 [Torulaspora globosa]|uniref:ERAD-associated E3 ubiquitin-protein ligase component HRD3 n=1 Tax=Torulaspora globosa TaxID=48254 RepID=A0A7H9HN11_9SACH|nr:hypothetical protein HG537_0B05120 [Torulaspora sp. CBS 2947]